MPGYIVTLNNDTLQGNIDYQNWGNNPKKINFMYNRAPKATMYSALDIKSFSVNNEIYVGAIVDTEISHKEDNYLDHNEKLNIKVDTTFLLTIVSNTKGLYYNKNTDGYINFYIGQNGQYELLIYKRFTKVIEQREIQPFEFKENIY